MRNLLVHTVFPGWMLACWALQACGQPTRGLSETLLQESSFEKDKPFKEWSWEVCRPSAIVKSSDVARKGSHSARFELAKTDAIQHKGYVRAELKQKFDSDPTGESWYAFSHFFPPDYEKDPLPEIIAQWHEIPDRELGEDWRSAPISLQVKNDSFYVKVMWARSPVNTNKTKDGEIFYPLGPVEKNQWHDWIFHIRFRYDESGLLEVYKNKKKVIGRNGPNCYNDQHFPYFKLGIYKSGWASPEWASRSPEDKRVLFIDAVKVGNRFSSLEEVSPE